MSAECAICYAADPKYLLPSIISAAGVRRSVPAHKADIYIFLDGEDDELVARINRQLEPLHITVNAMGPTFLAELASQQIKGYGDGYISKTTLARFYIGQLVPASCRQLIYLDGDTLMRGDVSPLVDHEVPEGRVAAVEDIFSFRANRWTKNGRRLQAYFEGLGVTPKNGYFNAGVFAVSRKTWLKVGAEAFTFFKTQRARCMYHDQSAMNAVTGDRRLRLSLKWNFQSPARFMGIEPWVHPKIYHFNQAMKPWMGSCKPWTDVYPKYMAELSPFEDLGLTMPGDAGPAEIERHNRLNPVKNLMLEWPWLARATSRPMGVEAYERQTWM